MLELVLYAPTGVSQRTLVCTRHSMRDGYVRVQSFGPMGMWRGKEGVQRSFVEVYGYAHSARMGSSQEAGSPRSTCGTVGQPGTEGFGAGVKCRVSRLLCRGKILGYIVSGNQ